MMPIWIYDTEAKKYVLIPYDKMDTFPDGTKGFYGYHWATSTLTHPAEVYAFVKKFRDYFQWAEGIEQARWVFAGQKIHNSRAWTGRKK